MTFRRIGKSLLPVASGVLAALALPGFGAGPLVFVALVPWFCTLEDNHGFRNGVLFGATLFALDFLRGLGPLGIGFSALHLALYRIPVLVQLAAYAGPLAITACIVVCNVGV